MLASDGVQTLPAAAQVQWSLWLIGVVVVYGVLPRLAPRCCAWSCCAQARRPAHRPALPGHAAARPAGTRRGLHRPGPPVDPLHEPRLSAPAPAGLDGRPVLLALELPNDLPWPPATTPAGIQIAGRLDTREERRRILDALADAAASRLLIACDARQTPDRGTLTLIAELAAHAQQTRVWLLLPAHEDGPARARCARSSRRWACPRRPCWRPPPTRWTGWRPDMADSLIRIAVVGHTNTGKTSLLRTLTRDTRFGEVADSPGTTRHVEGARLRIEGGDALEWFDTPGMEDSISLLEYLERLEAPGERLDGPARVRRFLDTPEAHGRYEQEARVLAKMLDCDAALYVIDARDPVLGKHRDELDILAPAAGPAASAELRQRAAASRRRLARGAGPAGLHAVVEFDTVAPALDGERQLYARLAVLLDRHAAALTRLSDALARQRQERRAAAFELLADLLIDVPRCACPAPMTPTLAAAAERLRVGAPARTGLRHRAAGAVQLPAFRYRRRCAAAAGRALGHGPVPSAGAQDMGLQLGMGAPPAPWPARRWTCSAPA